MSLLALRRSMKAIGLFSFFVRKVLIISSKDTSYNEAETKLFALNIDSNLEKNKYFNMDNEKLYEHESSPTYRTRKNSFDKVYPYYDIRNEKPN